MIGQKIRKIVRETIEWRILATIIDIIVIYFSTGNFWKSTALGIALMIIKTIIYFIWKYLRKE